MQAEIDLNSARGDALEKTISVVANASGNSNAESLDAQITALQRAVPDIFDASGKASAKKAPTLAPAAAPSAGLVNRAAALFSLLGYRRSMDSLVKKTTALQASVTGLAKPIGAELRSSIQAGDDAAQGSAQISDPAQLELAHDKIENLATQVRYLSAALVPLEQEVMALENIRTNLADWKKSVVSQTNLILRVFFLRAIVLAIVLGVLAAISEIWRRATFKYVHDPRRRRQFLLIRRFTTSILMTLVIVMGFVSDFSSVATFAGFITAGIAVALQTVILSVAAYFFLIGRYGVRVGDRVTVSGVTGDVIDIGLVRVFLMELAGTGVDLHPTGRVVVLANSALFSSSPLYKQLPGTNYAWHEIYVAMAGDADASKAEELLLKAVNTVYGGYRATIERQHGALEQILDYKTDLPVPSAQVRLTDAGLEVVVRYPAEIRKMSEIDEAVTREVLAMLRGDEALKKSLTSMPRIRAAVKRPDHSPVRIRGTPRLRKKRCAPRPGRPSWGSDCARCSRGRHGRRLAGTLPKRRLAPGSYSSESKPRSFRTARRRSNSATASVTRPIKWRQSTSQNEQGRKVPSPAGRPSI